jgi:hypothetical protein
MPVKVVRAATEADIAAPTRTWAANFAVMHHSAFPSTMW